MAVDSSALLNGLQPLDIAGAVNKGNVALQGQISTEDMQQEHGDKQVIRDLSSVPGVDFSTPKGIKEFMGHLQGRVAPETIMKLGDMSTKMETAEAARVSALAKQTTEKRQQYADQADLLYGTLGDVITEKDPIKQKDLFTAKIAKLRAEKIDENTPTWMSAAIDHLEQSPQAQWGDLFKGSSHAKELSQRANEEALAAERTSKANFWKDGGKVENWVSKEGKPLLKHQDGTFYSVDENGDPTKLAAMPEGAYLASKNKPDSSLSMGIDFTKEPPTKGEQEAARRFLLTGKQDQVGTGSFATRSRLRVRELAAAEAEKMNLSAEDRVRLQNRIRASQGAEKSLISQEALVDANAGNVMNTFRVLEDEVRKLGGPDSPKIKKLLNSAYSEWSGDADYTGINSAYVDAVESVGKLYSGVTGAGGTPVAFLQLAKETLPSQPSLAQIMKAQEVVPKLFSARKKSFEDELKAIDRMVALPDTVEGESSASKANPPTSASPADKLADEKMIKEREFELAQKQLAIAKAEGNPARIAQAENDVNALRKEVARINNVGTKPPTKNAKGWVLNTDAKGNMAYVGPNKEIEEIK